VRPAEEEAAEEAAEESEEEAVAVVPLGKPTTKSELRSSECILGRPDGPNIYIIKEDSLVPAFLQPEQQDKSVPLS
jgi:hypothetical protein